MFKLALALCVVAVASAGDCKFSYSAWTKCSKQCGSGVQYRNVKVSAYPTNGGAACPTSSTRVCNSHKCGDCKFTYKSWTKCSKARTRCMSLSDPESNSLQSASNGFRRARASAALALKHENAPGCVNIDTLNWLNLFCVPS